MRHTDKKGKERKKENGMLNRNVNGMTYPLKRIDFSCY